MCVYVCGGVIYIQVYYKLFNYCIFMYEQSKMCTRNLHIQYIEEWHLIIVYNIKIIVEMHRNNINIKTMPNNRRRTISQ